MKSARSKKLDQLYLSIAELKKGGEYKKLASLVKSEEKYFKDECMIAFGPRWLKRLQNSAKRAEKSPFVYAMTVLLK